MLLKVYRRAVFPISPLPVKLRRLFLIRRMATTIANGHRAPIHLYDLAPEPGICPYAQRTKIVLKEKGLPFTITYVDKKNKSKEFLTLFRTATSNANHRGTVPVIVDGDVKLAESLVTSEYLDLQYPDSGTKLFPTDPYKLALVRLFVENYTTQVQPAGAKVISSATLQEYKDALQAFTESLKVLDTFLASHGDKNGPFLLGNQFSFAEVATLPFFYRAHQVFPVVREIDIANIIAENEFDHLKKWTEAGFKRDSVKSTFPSDDVLKANGKERATVALRDLK